MNICPKCGLPIQACVCQEIAKTEQRIKIEIESKRFGKMMTLLSGIRKGFDIKSLAKELKSELACGGTVKNGVIELQGDHRKKLKQLLIEMGFPEETIE